MRGFPGPWVGVSGVRVARMGRGLACACLTGLVIVAAGCGGDGDHTNVDAGQSSPPPDPAQVDVANADRCSILDSHYCLFPWPSNYYTQPADNQPTGLKINIAQASLPANKQGVHVDPSEWNRNDGFSPNQTALVRVPGLDLDQTGAVRITDMSKSLDPDTPLMVIDAQSGEQHLVWAELDATAGSDQNRALLIRPAVQYEEGHRYIVVLRNLKDADGDRLQASDAFRIYRDNVASDVPEIEARRAHMNDLFATLASDGIDRDDLYLAWDFTIASRQSDTQRLLHIRDSAAASLGGNVPAFAVSAVDDFQNSDPAADDYSADIAREVRGTFTVPNFLNTEDGGPGSGFFYSDTPADGLPDRMDAGTNDLTADFVCRIPYAALSGKAVTDAAASDVAAARPSLYGHGLLGSRTEVRAGNVGDMANSHDMMFCATDWIGFAQADTPVAIGAFQDFSLMPAFFDRTQQGILDFEFLARLLNDGRGLASAAAFQIGGTPVFDDSAVFYDGNSQGGILGGAYMGVSQVVKRGVLGVPGMNYSLLLRRSADFAQFIPYFSGTATGGGGLPPATGGYSDVLDRTFLVSFVQMLWDRAEAGGYASHIATDPLPDTPQHQVLMQVAFGDHQVSMWSADMMARTIGARLHTPALMPGRHPSDKPFVGLDPVTDPSTYDGSAIVYWDNGPVRTNNAGDVVAGTAPPPTTNTAPTSPEYGVDPHELPRNEDAAQQQKSDFLQVDGTFTDTCNGEPCTMAGYDP